MRALVLKDNLTLRQDYPSPGVPTLPPGEALIRVRQAGICNTDLELLRGYANFEGVPGHEFVGQVQAWTAPCSLHSDEGEQGKHRLVRKMLSCSRNLG